MGQKHCARGHLYDPSHVTCPHCKDNRKYQKDIDPRKIRDFEDSSHGKGQQQGTVWRGERNSHPRTIIEESAEPHRYRGNQDASAHYSSKTTAQTVIIQSPKSDPSQRPVAGWLVMVSDKFPHNRYDDYTLYAGKNLIGHSKMCDVLLNYKDQLSAVHSSIRFEGGKVLLTDCDSDEGTFVGGQQHFRTEIQDGDVIRFGSLEFVFQCINNMGETASAAFQTYTQSHQQDNHRTGLSKLVGD